MGARNPGAEARQPLLNGCGGFHDEKNAVRFWRKLWENAAAPDADAQARLGFG
jgi:hypothetical protein